MHYNGHTFLLTLLLSSGLFPLLIPHVSAEPSPAPEAGFSAGIDFERARRNPPNTTGAVGIDHLVTVTDGRLAILDRSGGIRKSTTLRRFFGDRESIAPRVTFDDQANRWYLCASTVSGIVVMVSRSENPLGDFHRYEFNVDPTGNTGADFLHLGFNSRWICVSFDAARTTTKAGKTRVLSDQVESAKLLIVEKDTVLSGDEVSCRIFDLGDEAKSVAVSSASSENDLHFLSVVSGNSQGAGLIQTGILTGSVENPTFRWNNSTRVQEPWSSRFGDDVYMPQKDAAIGVAAGDHRAGNLVFHEGSLWSCHSAFLPADNPQRSGIRWYELTTGGSWFSMGSSMIPSPRPRLRFPVSQ